MKQTKYLIVVLLLFLSKLSIAQNAGDLDTTFGSGGVVVTEFESYSIGMSHFKPDGIRAIFPIADGKILCAGTADNGKHFIAARYNENGSIDETYGTDGFSIYENLGLATCASMLDDGRLIIGGFNSHNFVLLKLKSNGDVDSTFGVNGVVITEIDSIYKGEIYDILIQNNKIIITGSIINDTNIYMRSIVVAKYLEDGVIDSAFGVNGITTTLDFPASYTEESFSITVLYDNSILVSGHVQFSHAIVKLTPLGIIDSTFGVNGVKGVNFIIPGSGYAPGLFSHLKVESDSTILVTGNAFGPIPNIYPDRIVLAKIDVNGNFDSTFAENGKSIYIDIDSNLNANFANSLVIEEDNKIIISGYRKYGTNYCFQLVRFHENGDVDSSFGVNGIVRTTISNVSAAFCSALQEDGKLLVAGVSDSGAFTIARYHTSSASTSTEPHEGRFETFSIYPNPVNDILYLDISSDIIRTEISDISGRNYQLPVMNHSVNVSSLPVGVYFIKITSEKGEFVRKFVKE